MSPRGKAQKSRRGNRADPVTEDREDSESLMLLRTGQQVGFLLG